MDLTLKLSVISVLGEFQANMERWQNRVAVVTGASAGIGAAIVRDLLNAGVVVVGLARRLELMEQTKAQLPVEQQKRYHPLKCDVGSVESVNAAFDRIIQQLGGVDILINNAGILKSGQLLDGDLSYMQNALQVNIMGVVLCTRRAFQSMKERNFDGHVVNINSIVGHVTPMNFSPDPPPMNIYGPTKYAVTALTELFRQEFKGFKTKVKITSISPGITDTDIVVPEYRGIFDALKPEDVSQCVMFTLSTPPSMQVHEIMVQPTAF